MKLTSVLSLLVAVASAVPTPTIDEAEHVHIEKRATISEAATLGYASTNGGTTGGAGGTVTTVSTLPQFTAAVNEKDATPRIVVVKGIISGSANIRIGSNKSVIGLPGAGTCLKMDYSFPALMCLGFDGIGLYARRQKNIILRNIISRNVLGSVGDGFRIDVRQNNSSCIKRR